jgi:hypothetical protein
MTGLGQETSPRTIALTNANAAQNITTLRDFVKSIGTPPLSMPPKDMLLAQGRKGNPCCIAAGMWKIVSF